MSWGSKGLTDHLQFLLWFNFYTGQRKIQFAYGNRVEKVAETTVVSKPYISRKKFSTFSV